MAGTRRIRPSRPDARLPESEATDLEVEPAFEADDEPAATTVLEVGRKVGRYRLCGELASGGMATVHLALLEGAAGFEKVVALKEIHPHLAKREAFVRMFLDEARIASRIQHPNVCNVFDFGEGSGRYYLAMEFLVGEPLISVLTQLSRASGFTWPRHGAIAAKILSDACEGLHAAHELTDAQGRPLEVVHRDVSMHNLFVTYSGVTKVVDFGIAKAADKLHQTHTGEVKGSLAYMAPEQLGGAAVTRTADVWSLGVVAWELFTGRRLFKRGSNVETMYAVTGGEIPRAQLAQPALPAAVDDVLARALSRTPEARQATARQLGRELVDAVGVHATAAEVAEWLERVFPRGHDARKQLVAGALDLATRKHRTRRAWIASAGVSAVAVSVAGAALWWPTDRARPIGAPSLASGEPTTTHARTLSPPDGTSPVRAEGDRTRGADTGSVDAGSADAGSADAAPTTNDASQPGPEDDGRRRELGEPDTTAPREPERGFGQLNLVTRGAASEVFHRGRSLGWTPLTRRLPAGRYALELRPRGDLPRRRVRVTVRAGATTRQTVDLAER